MRKSVFCAALCAAVAVAQGAVDGVLNGTMKMPLLTAGGASAYLIATDGSVAWSAKGLGNVHEVWLHGGKVYWSNGDVWCEDVVTRERKRVYSPCEKEGVFGFDFAKNGNLVVAENGTDHVAELKAGTWEPVVRFKANPANEAGKVPGGAHHHFRMVRKTAADTYLVCCSSAHFVREYDKTGRLVWEVKVPNLAFDAIRLKNGNTMVGHLDAVTEYTPAKEIAWQFKPSDAPELKLGNLCGVFEETSGWNTTGNFVFGTYANGDEAGSRATIVCVNRAKKVQWSYAAKGRRFSNMCANPVPYHRWPVGVAPVSAQEAKEQDALLARFLAAPPAKPRRVLVVTRAFGYCHNDAMTFGDRAIRRAGEISGAWQTEFTADVSKLADGPFLSRFDAVAINNSTSIRAKAFPGMREALTAFVKEGKGLCLIHSAVDSFYDDETLADMNGGLFRGHPWHAGGNWSFRVEKPNTSLTGMFKGEIVVKSDEIYQQTGPAYSREKDTVLVSMNMADAKTAAAAKAWKGWLRDDNDFAVSWIRPYGKGRVFYTSFGHDRRAFLDPERLYHVLAGLQYCLGDLAF